MTERQSSNSTWKWIIGILITVLIGSTMASTANSITRLDSQEVRITNVEKVQAVSQAATQAELGYIRQSLEEVKNLLKEHSREVK